MITAIIVIILTITAFKLFFSKNIQTYHSHWQTMYQNFKFSPLEFYELLTKELQSKQIKGLRLENITLREGTILSAKRVHLKIEYQDLEYNICCSPCCR